MRDGTVILSDLHLGRPGGARSAESLRPLWSEAGHLVLNGDVAEIHHPRHRAAAARETLWLLERCEADGVDVTILSGNHDPFISDHRHLDLAGGQVLVTHGDVFHPAVAPWSPKARRMRDVNDEALSALHPETRHTLEARLAASQLAGHAEWADMEHQSAHSNLASMLLRPWSFAQVIAYWRAFPALAAAFARDHRPRATFVVTGHTHRAGAWTLDGRTVLNTGAFGRFLRPHGVIIASDSIQLRPIVLRSGRYAFADNRVMQAALAPSNAPAPRSARNTRDVSGRLSAISI